MEAATRLREPLIEILGYGGAKGGGKSYFARTWQVLRRLTYPKSKGLLIRKTFPELQRNHIEKLKKELPYGSYGYSDKTHSFTFPNGSIMELGYLESEKDLGRYQGAEYDDIVFDEAEHHIKKIVQEMRSCLRTTRKDLKPKMILTFNPGGIGHAWLKKLFIQREYEEGESPEQFGFVKALVFDNPSIMLNDPEYVRRLEALPEPLRSAYLKGDFDVFEGQFFTNFGLHNREDPFVLPGDCQSRLFASLDHGIAHFTSFGLWYIDTDLSLHRVLSYYSNGGTTQGHAAAIWDMVESSWHSHGYFPMEVYYDPSMDAVEKLSERMYRSNIDEYKDYFGSRELSKHVVFKPANNRKVDGCHIMRALFDSTKGRPVLSYFDGYNASFAEGVCAVLTDKNNKEIYTKMDGDDAADEARYGCVAGWTKINQMLQVKNANSRSQERLTPIKDQLKPIFFSMRR